MKRFFHLYAVLGPLLLMPLAAWGWWVHYGGNVPLAALALGVPILHAYVVPAVGTNVLGMWAFNARFKLGLFRPQHGFVFGSATALFALPLVGAPDPDPTLGSVASAALLTGGVLLAVNWAYDALAIRHGVLEVYNQPWFDGEPPWAIAADYVVPFFGVFGLIYGGGLKLAEVLLLDAPDAGRAALIGLAMAAATVGLPSLLYVAASTLRHGHSGLRPFPRAAAPSA